MQSEGYLNLQRGTYIVLDWVTLRTGNIRHGWFDVIKKG